nr:hypothetical protein Iba_chr01fCG5650 [Ipomoea batatas]
MSCSCVCSFEFVVFIVGRSGKKRSAALPGKKRRKRSRTCCCSRRKKWRNRGEQRRRNREAKGHWKSLQLTGRSEEEYGICEKHRKAVALLREPPEVAATLNCCRNFASLPSPALRWRSSREGSRRQPVVTVGTGGRASSRLRLAGV